MINNEINKKSTSHLINKPKRAKQIYILVRHGSRFPSGKQIIASGDFLDNFKSFRLNQILNQNGTKPLDEIYFSFKDVKPYELTDLGKTEMIGIAERYRQRFPSLFKKEGIDVMSSYKDRSVNSAQSFIKGLFPTEKDATGVIDRIHINNRIMRLFDECSRYVKGVKQNSTAMNEFLSFKNGHHIKEILDNIKRRNDIQEMDSLDSSTIYKCSRF